MPAVDLTGEEILEDLIVGGRVLPLFGTVSLVKGAGTERHERRSRPR